LKLAVTDITAKDIIQDNMMDYGAYVILQRAIPDLRDGLKPVHRRILYTLHLEKATKFTKSANIEGAVMKIHPHGSSYGTMVNMAQKDRQSLLFINGKGNFGQATSRDLAPAAARYTEVKLSDFGIEMMSGLNKNLVNFVPNYDGTSMVPEVLPVRFPVILTQASSGVAYGMASSIPSFNAVELSNAMIKFIREGKKVLLIPDFATKGFIVNNPDIFKKINLEGSGSVQVRGKAEIDGSSILITEIPHTTTREAIIDKIVALSKDKLKEVVEVKDLTDLKGMKVRVRFRRGTNVSEALEKLYQLTPLQDSYSTNLNVLINGSPKVMGVWGVITEWIKWRRQTIIRGLEFDIAKMKKELHFLRGLEKVLLDIDAAIEIIRRSKADMIEKNLMDKFNIDEVQAKEVADMKLRNINEDYIIKKIQDIQKLEDKITDFEDIVKKEDRQNELIIKDLEEVRDKYGVERQSKLINVNTDKIKAVKKKMEQVPDYPVKLFVTKEGYVKKSRYGGTAADQYLKPGDEIVSEYDAFNLSEFLVFGSDKCCYKIKVSDIEESTNRALGVFIKSVCELDGDIVGTSVLDDSHKFIIISYDNNKVAKIKLDSFAGNRKKLANSLAKSADVVGILTFKDEGKFILKSPNGEVELMTSGFELKERWTQGVFAARKGKPTSIRKA
jgi:DNA gyrase subunit A